MKKTLTVNLSGTIFSIDEDAYRLLDNYLCDLKLHFRKNEGAEEIVNDIENRISELFTEKVGTGLQVITITDVEEVITRMGKPEDFGEEEEEEDSKTASAGSGHTCQTGTNRRLYRNPDDKLLGGVISGLAAYLNCDVTLLRFLALIFLIFGYGTLVPVYIVCWIVIPEARAAAEKLHMRGEDVTIESIGKTVTDGFEKVYKGANNYMNSEKSRTFVQRLGDMVVSIIGFFLKACLVVFAIICSPVLFVIAIVFVALILGAIAAAIGGGALLYELLPSVDWSPLASVSPMMTVLGSMAGVALIGIPLAGIVYTTLRSIFNWPSMATGLKWSLFVLWLLGLALFIINLSALGWQLSLYGIHAV